MKIAICSLAIGKDFKRAVFPSQYTKVLYCQKHGYDYIEDETVYDKSRPIAWSKILLIQKYLDKYDYIVWIDADAMIMNFDHKLEDKITKFMEDKDMMVISPYPRINTGVWFLKNTDYTHTFLTRLYNMTEFTDETKYGDWEQNAFIHLVETDEDVTRRVKVLPHEYEPEIQSYWFAFHPGHFILHLCGYRGHLEHLKIDLHRFCMIRLPNENEEMYKNRVDWMTNGGYRKHVDERMRGYK